MKKVIFALLSIFFTVPCLANIHINPSTVESVVKEFVPADKMVSVISEYNNQLKQSNRAGISAQAFWDICAIAGWDIKQPSGKSQCQEFVTTMVQRATINFYHACDKIYKGKSAFICVDDFFTNKIYGGTQVNLTPGQTLAREYARLKHNDTTVQCKNKFDPGTLDDRLMCTSHDKNAYYEFVFDDLEEPKDQTIKNSIQNAICRMYDAKPTKAGCAAGGTNVSGTPKCWGASCAADAAKCEKINQSMAKFGYLAEYKNGKCEINFNTITKQEDLKTAYGIDNFVFCHGIQVSNTPDVESYLKQYVAERAGVSTSSVKCDSGFNTYTGTGCTRNGISDLKDDIKTCRVGNNQIDFVFDDINEKWKKTAQGGVQGMSCVVSGGTFSGKRCIGLGQQQCNVLRQSNLTECPECKAAKWDDETQSCILPSSASAQNLKRGINITMIVGGAIVGIVITVATVGTATAAVAGAAAATKSAIVFTAIETVGAGIEVAAQLKIDAIADDFLVESNKCKTTSCAEQLIKENLQRMSNIANDMTDAERKAVDDELARLIGLLHPTSQFFIDIVAGESLIDKNHKSMLEADSWEPEQVWRAVGLTLQLASVFTAVGKWVLTKAGVLGKTLPNATSAMTRQARQTGIEVQKMVRSGREVKTSNGRIVKIPDYASRINPSAIDDVAVRQIYQNAYDAEKIITDDMVEVTSRAGGELSGLENRMKTPESITKKVAKDRSGGKVIDGMSDADVVSGFSDIVRYTQTGSTKTLTRQIKQTLSELEAKGYRINKIKNRFNTPIGEYKDFMVQLEHVQTGQKVELQFNTPKNLILKEKGHPLYKIIDNVNSSAAAKKAAQIEMQKIYSDLEIPDGIVNFVYN